MLVGDLTLTELLGEGHFAKIYLTSKKRRIKKIYLNNEIYILKDINHHNIIKFIETHQDSINVYIVTELCNGGTLLENLMKYKKENKTAFTEEIVKYMMKQIVEAIKYLHNKKIVHRNINLKNIMLNYDDENDKIYNNIMKGKIKIIDLGFSRYLKKGNLAKSILGCPITMSPIILNKLNEQPNYKDIGYDEKEEIWSLGCICYELLLGYNPFESVNMNESSEKVNKGDYYVPITLSKEAVSFLNGMLQFEPNNRLSADKLYNHKFLRKNVKEFNKIDINELKNIEIINNSKIKINTNNNKAIFDNFGNGL